jgi:hypothetical protein
VEGFCQQTKRLPYLAIDGRTVFTSGKHKGLAFAHVIKIDAKYSRWVLTHQHMLKDESMQAYLKYLKMHYQPISEASDLIDLTEAEEYTGTPEQMRVAQQQLTGKVVKCKKEPPSNTAQSQPQSPVLDNRFDELMEALIDGLRRRLTVTSTASSSGVKREHPGDKKDPMDTQ